MSSYYPVISALIFSVAAIGNLTRALKQWPVQVGPLRVPMGLHAIIGLSPAQSGLAARIGGGCIEASNCVAILPM